MENLPKAAESRAVSTAAERSISPAQLVQSAEYRHAALSPVESHAAASLACFRSGRVLVGIPLLIRGRENHPSPPGGDRGQTDSNAFTITINGWLQIDYV